MDNNNKQEARYDFYRYYFDSLVGAENVGWFSRAQSGELLMGDSNNVFAGVVSIAPDCLAGSTAKDYPWACINDKVVIGDTDALSGAVRETMTLYFNAKQKRWRRLLGVKWAITPKLAAKHHPRAMGAVSVNEDVIFFMCADVTDLGGKMNDQTGLLVNSLDIDYNRQRCNWVNVNSVKCSVNRLDLVCLSYMLDGLSRVEISKKLYVTAKAIDKRIAKLRDQVLMMPNDSMQEVCREWGVRAALEIKRDWFDTTPVVSRIYNLQWHLTDFKRQRD